MTHENKHTQGPWGHTMQEGGYAIMTEDDGKLFRTVATIRNFPFSFERVTEQANANLIAAAPELLEALEVALVSLSTMRMSPDRKGVLRKCKAAINKARGE